MDLSSLIFRTHHIYFFSLKNSKKKKKKLLQTVFKNINYSCYLNLVLYMCSMFFFIFLNSKELGTNLSQKTNKPLVPFQSRIVWIFKACQTDKRWCSRQLTWQCVDQSEQVNAFMDTKKIII